MQACDAVVSDSSLHKMCWNFGISFQDSILRAKSATQDTHARRWVWNAGSSRRYALGVPNKSYVCILS